MAFLAALPEIAEAAGAAGEAGETAGAAGEAGGAGGLFKKIPPMGAGGQNSGASRNGAFQEAATAARGALRPGIL